MRVNLVAVGLGGEGPRLDLLGIFGHCLADEVGQLHVLLGVARAEVGIGAQHIMDDLDLPVCVVRSGARARATLPRTRARAPACSRARASLTSLRASSGVRPWALRPIWRADWGVRPIWPMTGRGPGA